MDLYTKSTISSPTATLFKESDDFSKKNLPLIIHGQGVFIFENKNNDKIGFSFYNKERKDGLRVELNTSNVIVTRISSNKQLIFFHSSDYRENCVIDQKEITKVTIDSDEKWF